MHISAAAVGATAVDTLFDMVNFSKLPIMVQNYNISIGFVNFDEKMEDGLFLEVISIFKSSTNSST